MQFCANNLKTIAFSKIFIGCKSVQHDEIYLCAYFEENSFTSIRVIALFRHFLAFLMFKLSKIYSSETTEQNLMKLGQKHLWYVYYKSYVRYGRQPKTLPPLLKIEYRGQDAVLCKNLKTIAFSKIFMGSKSVQHDEIYLCAYSLTDIRVIALFRHFLAFLMFKISKIFSSETTEERRELNETWSKASLACWLQMILIL